MLWKKQNWKEVDIYQKFYFFIFFLVLQKFDSPNVKFYLPAEKSTIQYKAD